MNINTNLFFKEAALKICSNLEIDKAMHDCFHYLNSLIPLDIMYMQVLEQNLNSMRIIARASKNDHKQMNILVPLPEKINNAIKKGSSSIQKNPKGPLWIINNSEESPITASLIESLEEKPSSLLGMLLIIKDKPLGYLICLAYGKNKYTNDHLELLSLLHDPFYIALSNALEHREVILLKDMLIDDNHYLQQELMHKSGKNIIGMNFGLKKVMEMVKQVASLNSPVLLLGETGTGKDLIANAIHYSSPRSRGPFISVNCGAIPDTLIDSELFGHEKGAFTGAISQKRGRFERADRGTIFLDEIGELPPQVQVRLLRVLQNKEIERVGGTKTIHLDIRIIAATNKHLEKMVKNKTFREDLWFRLNVFPIILPPLRQRKPDIPALVRHFLFQKCRELKLPAISEVEQDSIDLLMEYSWPGNVRELENIVERALILNKNGPVSFKNLIQINYQVNDVEIKEDENIKTLDEIIIQHIKKVLKKTKGKIHGPGGAAELLGINASTLRNRMKKLGIQFK